MRVPEDHFTEREGVLAVQALFNSMGWLCREHPTSDFGIDAHVEVVTNERATGRLLALQIKSGASYFRQTDDEDITYYGDRAHLDYWLNHALPVVVVLYEPGEREAYWQLVAHDTVEYTEQRWKLRVPWNNQLGAASAKALEKHAEGDPLALLLRKLELERPWMERLRAGEVLLLDVDEWINKSSGRGDFRLVVFDRHVDEQVVHSWPFQLFPGIPYGELIPGLLPWASIELHEQTYEWADQDLWEQEEGVWDSEDGRYVMVGESFEDWRTGQPSGLRPYETGDEIAKWRLELKLGPLGDAFLTLHDFLQDSFGDA